MSFEQINKIVNSVSTLIENSEKIAVPVLSVKLAKALRSYPEDQTLAAMSNVISKIASNRIFISRGEIKDLYKKLYSRNTKFAELFSDELGEVLQVKGPTIYNRDGEESKLSTIEEAYEKLADPVLSRALAGVFGDENYKSYSKNAEESAKYICERELSDLGAPAESIEVAAGQEDLIICKASFETPKGISNVLIPVEIVNEKALIPSVFIGNAGPEDLKTPCLSSYIVASAGNKLNLNFEKVLKIVSLAKTGPKENISNVELALTKLNASKESKGEYFSNQILFQKVAEVTENLEINTPKYKDSEAASFSEMLGSAAGIAEFKFGKDKVKSARNIVLNRMNSFGFDKSQISVIDVNDSTVFYAVAINGGRTGFRVPVKMSDKYINPTILISNGLLKSFSQKSITDLLNKDDTDFKAIASASPLYNIKSSELINIVRTAMEEENYAKAEDALNVLQESNDEKAYNVAFSVFKDGLNKTASKVNRITACSRIIKSANSKYELCGHTNLPVHKVYQDKNGDCQPEYRKGKDETFEGGFFMAHKILL